MRHHRDMLGPEYWKGVQQDIRDGRQRDVFPYSVSKALSLHLRRGMTGHHAIQDGGFVR